MTHQISRKHTLMTVIILLLATVSLYTAPSFGQATSTGTVVGTITDPTGAVVAGAMVTLTEAATSTVRTTTTSASGQYVLVNVPPGDYAIRVTKTGFSTSEIQHQTVSVGTQSTADLELTVGGTQTVVEVSAQSSKADLQTMNATIGATVNPLEIDSLPSVQRDASTFATLQPGVTPGGSVAGTVTDQAVFQLDGGNNSSDMDGSMLNYTGSFGGNTTGVSSLGAGSSGVMPMPQDSIEEFKVATAGQTADFNNSSGFQAQVVTKRGTNVWHGTVYEYYLDSNIGANTWQNNHPATYLAKPSYHYNRFGANAGGAVLPSHFGGKTYLFANYEGWRWPNSATYERAVPSANMRLGIVNLSGANYNLNTLDPRGVGISPIVAKMWNTQLPAGNDPQCSVVGIGARCDGINTIGYRANILIAQKSDFGVARLDHDFGSKWHFMASYRYFKLTKATTNQVDIGGVIGGKLGVPTALANRPQDPWYLVAGLTTNISSTFTNDFHYSYLRNVWSWNDANAPSQLAGLGGALEPFGEFSTTALTPYNVDTQDIRTRFWDGQDNFFRDDLTKLKGRHLFQFGGQYQHNYNYHQRTDNGGGINFTTTYQLGDSSGGGLVSLPGLAAKGVPTSGTTNPRIIDAVLGIVTDSQVAYTRAGANLTLNAPLTPAFDQATIPYYNLYVTDTWHMSPSVTLNYGLGWALEMPPVEKNGKQVALVDVNDNPIKTVNYLAARQQAATSGQVYNPEVGFALVHNVAGGGLKYPYNPYYASFSPRVAVAWNPHISADSFMSKIFGQDTTVIRGGYGRVYGRLNGVGLVLTPLLAPGLIQAVQCRTAMSNGTCGSSNPTDTTAFRVGVDGTMAPLAVATTTLPQPLYPGYNGAASATAAVLDPDTRPNSVDSFNFTIQRQINSKMLFEVGYIGRVIHNEFQPRNLNAVPYMMSLGGQSFAQAYAAVEGAFGCTQSAGLCNATTVKATTGSAKVYPAVSAQPFFETALAGTGYCTGYANCTTAVVQKEAGHFGNQQVFNLWSDLDNGGFNFARTMMNTPIPGQPLGGTGQMGSGIGMTTSSGYGNYNALFFSYKVTNLHGLTWQSNFTYSKALGVGAEAQATSSYTSNDPFDLSKSYGVQPFNQKFIFNTYLVYQTPWYHDQSTWMGRLAGGWFISPILTAGTGQPMTCVTNGGAQAYGGADDLNFTTTETCLFTSAYTGGYHTHRNVAGGLDPNGVQVGSTSPTLVSMFANPVQVYGQVRPNILGVDFSDAGSGPISGLPYWNLDMSIRKNVKVWERASLEFSGVMTNILNHNVFSNPTFSLATPATFGIITGQGNLPRAIQMGARVNF